MYRKLMFLISFVALLALVNVASADEVVWIGTGSFCDPANWDGGVVPGPDDEAIVDCDSGGGDIVIDCDVEVDRLHGPAYEGDCNQTMDIVSGTIIANDRFRAVMEGSKIGWVNMTGGDIIVNGEMRLNDDGADAAYWNMSGGSLTVYHRVRSGDNDGGPTNWNFTGDALVNVDRYFRIGDDGCGSFTVGGNAQVNVGLDEGEDGMLYFVCRKMSVTVDISGNCEIWVRESFDLGNPGQAGGKAPATCHMTMSGGTLSAEKVQVGWDPDGDFVASLTMTGGLIICREDLRVGPTSTVVLDGGVIEVLGGDSIEIDDGGSIDLTGGQLVLNGNKVAELAELVCVDGKITGYGTPAGVVIDYDNLNPGKTTAYGVPGVDPKKAYCPEPANGADKVQCVTTEVELCWTGGSGVIRLGGHRVYFGTDEQAVEDATMSDDEFITQTRADTTCYTIGNLPLWMDHYWRIDEVNSDFTVTKGDVWKFTTGCAAINGDTNNDCILNFLDYADVASTWQKEQLWP